MKTRKSKHFIFHYTLRSFDTGLGSEKVTKPGHSIYSLDHVIKYEEAFEKAWQYYHENKWVLPDYPISVYFLQIWPAEGLTQSTIGENTIILLPARHEDPNGPTNVARVEATAAHELFHVIQERIRINSFKNSDPWAWFGEATASFMETEVFPNSRQYLPALYKWFDQPDLPLNMPPNQSREYGGMIFCMFLRDRFPQKNLIYEVWKRANSIDSPVQAIQDCLNCLSGIPPFVSTSGNDLFTSEFLVWNFFLDRLNDPAKGYREASLFREKFQQVFAEHIQPTITNPIRGCELGPLSARYYTMSLSAKLDLFRMNVEMRAENCTTCPAKVIICTMSKKKILIGQYEFSLEASSKLSHFSGNWSLENIESDKKPSYILIVVANISTSMTMHIFIDDYTIKVLVD